MSSCFVAPSAPPVARRSALSKALLVAIVFVAACSGKKPEEGIAPPDPIVPGSKLAAPAPAPAPTPAPIAGSGSDSGSAGSGSAVDETEEPYDAVAEQKLHDDCVMKEPQDLLMSSAKQWVSDCVEAA